MFNFFIDASNKNGDSYHISGDNYNHIKNVLRMAVGDEILVSCDSKSDLCQISQIDSDCIIAKIIKENANCTELPVSITLFQGLPKSDKLELIIQKTVELGVSEIVPVEMKNCVVKLDEKKKTNKVTRWQAISESAAKQSKRNVIPKIGNVIPFADMINLIADYDMFLVPYENENGMKATVDALGKIKSGMRIGVLIGPEGGFDDFEINKAVQFGGIPLSLGKRILRTETAAIATVSLLMLYSEMNLGGD
ncbi:MAG: 16S rRNA (uracil(1498)-N(3))-methyltransferase [Clostridia bacterium]|nr:16S rRNA (uracil(1498)-N(3))-methyltransferase [Clostridia bacterium]